MSESSTTDITTHPVNTNQRQSLSTWKLMLYIYVCQLITKGIKYGINFIQPIACAWSESANFWLKTEVKSVITKLNTGINQSISLKSSRWGEMGGGGAVLTTAEAEWWMNGELFYYSPYEHYI